MTNTTERPSAQPKERFRRRRRGVSAKQKLSYLSRWMPNYLWQRLVRHQASGRTHLIFALADHFEPAIVPEDGAARAPYPEQERRLERWCGEYPSQFGSYRDAEGRPFVHTYYYPAEQYDPALIARLADHCRDGWGDIESLLHHGTKAPDSAENTRRQLIEFRDRLAGEHNCLSYWGDSPQPRYSFVHGNFALANSNKGRFCGVDSEMQVLAETGCYADFTLPTGAFHWAQTSKINAIYECTLPLTVRAPHRKGQDLERGRVPEVFPLIVQGPLMLDFAADSDSRRWRIDNAALTGSNPPSLRRLDLWKRAAIAIKGRPDWLFIKLHCHGMDARDEEATVGDAVRKFVSELVSGAEQRKEILHFVTAREMVNIVLAACDGREGNPGEYRDYQLKRERPPSSDFPHQEKSAAVLKG